MTFDEAKAARDLLEADLSRYSVSAEIVRSRVAETLGLHLNLGGLTPDAIKFHPEYRAAKANADAAFGRLRAFNSEFVKQFATELRAERRARYA